MGVRNLGAVMIGAQMLYSKSDMSEDRQREEDVKEGMMYLPHLLYPYICVSFSGRNVMAIARTACSRQNVLRVAAGSSRYRYNCQSVSSIYLHVMYAVGWPFPFAATPVAWRPSPTCIRHIYAERLPAECREMGPHSFCSRIDLL